MTPLDITDYIAIFLVIFLAIGIHEYAHAKLADMAGDPTPGIYGRVTLNLFKHFDPIGTIMIILTVLSGFGIGWGKPVPMDPRKMRNPKWDHFVAVIGGPASNFIQAMLFAVMFRLTAGQEIPFLSTFLLYGVLINVSLARSCRIAPASSGRSSTFSSGVSCSWASSSWGKPELSPCLA